MSEQVISDIISGKYTKIIILSGAGVSTNSGIPDYRSDTGIFKTLIENFDQVTHAEDLFSREFISKNPEVLQHSAYLDFVQKMAVAEPCKAHQLAKWLYDKGWLKRVYTQNVDGLYKKTGLPEEKIVEFHGSISKGNVILYDDCIDPNTLELTKIDFIEDVNNIDMIIVMGTSLQVLPFCALPNMVRKQCCRILVNIFPEHCYRNKWTPRHSSTGKYISDDPDPAAFTSTNLLGRKVSLQAWWNPRGKWKNQHIFSEDCDDWASKIMDYKDERTYYHKFIEELPNKILGLSRNPENDIARLLYTVNKEKYSSYTELAEACRDNIDNVIGDIKYLCIASGSLNELPPVLEDVEYITFNTLVKYFGDKESGYLSKMSNLYGIIRFVVMKDGTIWLMRDHGDGLYQTFKVYIPPTRECSEDKLSEILGEQ